MERRAVLTFEVHHHLSERESCCRALKLATMPSLSMHTKHAVVRRRDDGVLDIRVSHLQRGNGGR
jgi:hypothetical protein